MHKLPTLNYEYADLEPHIDAKTMEIHYSKHHQGYVNKLNAALENYSDLAEMPVEKLLEDLESLPTEVQVSVRNNGGGHYNHTLFWQTLTSKGTNEPTEQLLQAITEVFGGFDDFKEQFEKQALSRFGSGWAWLVVNSNGQLELMSTPNQDCPISMGKTPVLGLDVWEHAYYLNYQNKRAEYAKAFWNVVDWTKVAELYEDAVNSA